MATSIFKTLEQIGLTSKKSRVQFNDRTRDIEGLTVWRDTLTGVIYIDEFYVGNDVYAGGEFREELAKRYGIGNADYERTINNKRRFDSSLQYVAEKRVMDFGCGKGLFLRKIKPYCEEVIGVELEQQFVDDLNNSGIRCVNDLQFIEDRSLDIVVSFHVIEHLPNPLEILHGLTSKLVSGGLMLIEVPHANDFLLSIAHCEAYKQFALWSQHLVLHTRDSLRRLLEFVGLDCIQIEGVQRYPLSNHLHWLANGKPGGHRTGLSVIDTDELSSCYQNALARIDATDTLVAIARVP